MTKKIGMTVMLMLSLLAASCNTVKGMGEDIQASGRAIDNAATKVQSR